jgi:hypothetical protein
MGVALPVPGSMLIQEIREVELPNVGLIRKIAFPPALSVIVVAVQDAEAPVVLGVLFGVPLPMIVIPIPLGTVIPAVQVHVPAGILIVSPLTAVCVGPLITAFTSL